ncbi:MAG: hypothetical protein QOG20_4423 [Pseudonocardiales bacterium]|jgi:hypothetical protein|nr:hypothetical protein [Pseudonocardiales bacterium]
MVISDLGEVLAQNRMSLLRAGDQTGFAGDRRYLSYRWFTEPGTRAGHPLEEQERHARHLVADLRAVAGRRAGDLTVEGFVERLAAASPEFR